MQWNVYIFTENQKTYFFFLSVNFITQKTTSALLSLTSTWDFYRAIDKNPKS